MQGVPIEKKDGFGTKSTWNWKTSQASTNSTTSRRRTHTNNTIIITRTNTPRSIIILEFWNRASSKNTGLFRLKHQGWYFPIFLLPFSTNSFRKRGHPIVQWHHGKLFINLGIKHFLSVTKLWTSVPKCEDFRIWCHWCSFSSNFSM